MVVSDYGSSRQCSDQSGLKRSAVPGLLNMVWGNMHLQPSYRKAYHRELGEEGSGSPVQKTGSLSLRLVPSSIKAGRGTKCDAV